MRGSGLRSRTAAARTAIVAMAAPTPAGAGPLGRSARASNPKSNTNEPIATRRVSSGTDAKTTGPSTAASTAHARTGAGGADQRVAPTAAHRDGQHDGQRLQQLHADGDGGAERDQDERHEAMSVG